MPQVSGALASGAQVSGSRASGALPCGPGLPADRPRPALAGTQAPGVLWAPVFRRPVRRAFAQKNGRPESRQRHTGPVVPGILARAPAQAQRCPTARVLEQMTGGTHRPVHLPVQPSDSLPDPARWTVRRLARSRQVPGFGKAAPARRPDRTKRKVLAAQAVWLILQELAQAVPARPAGAHRTARAVVPVCLAQYRPALQRQMVPYPADGLPQMRAQGWGLTQEQGRLLAKEQVPGPKSVPVYG